ncbi:class I SAM-dependent methyltransferase [Zavarzinia compransoris]|uniref:class I SAM-dependent methyltransferase n=1 Tax=Zavarzinia marina TaxID=2911065 RepID=UPI001F2BF41A|nr:class I SAM-dependent methyltransferase [Zavarzinia marina]MCF4167506.1 class I SAM-dependent methyltransferase [Zavarzinia marina]
MSVPSYSEMVELVKEAGSSQQEFFGYPVKEGGLYLQQDPEEFAALVHFLAKEVQGADLTLDLGIASGGQTKFLRDYFDAKKTIIVDDGRHVLFPHWARIKPMVKTEFICEIIRNSHDKEVREQLAPWRGKVDFAFVDGDHSYRGLRQDIFMMKLMLRENAIMVLHDTAAVWDCKRVFDDLLRSREFTLLRNFDNRFGISVWKRLKPRTPPGYFNHQFGWGRL